jgi:hypothetical protein
MLGSKIIGHSPPSQGAGEQHQSITQRADGHLGEILGALGSATQPPHASDEQEVEERAHSIRRGCSTQK